MIIIFSGFYKTTCIVRNWFFEIMISEQQIAKIYIKKKDKLYSVEKGIMVES